MSRTDDPRETFADVKAQPSNPVPKEEVREWIFTFGYGQRLVIEDSTGRVHLEAAGVSLADGYVRVLGTYAQARAAMLRRFGGVWAFDYQDAEAVGVDRYGLHEALAPIDATGEAAS